MIPIEKLAKLAPRHRLRKAANVLTELERLLLGSELERLLLGSELERLLLGSELERLLPGTEPEPSLPGIRVGSGQAAAAVQTAAAYAARLASLIAGDTSAPEPVREAARRLHLMASMASDTQGRAGGQPGDSRALVRSVDALRHALLAATGQAPADWDLINPSTGRPDAASRRVHPGLRVYLEDLRSPFNLGAIFRTADAFGVEELLLSPMTAEPGHPRSQRSAMGAVELVPWRRSPLAELDGSEGVFALELGGQSIGDFEFPRRGIAIIGSEELGVSAEALSKCSLGVVSIPMSGAKASLNAAVAFGILMHAWTGAIDN